MQKSNSYIKKITSIIWTCSILAVPLFVSSCNSFVEDENLMTGIEYRVKENKEKGYTFSYTCASYTYFNDVENGEQKYCYFAEFIEYISEDRINNGKDLFMYVVGEEQTRELSMELYESITYYVQHGEYEGRLGYVNL